MTLLIATSWIIHEPTDGWLSQHQLGFLFHFKNVCFQENFVCGTTSYIVFVDFSRLCSLHERFFCNKTLFCRWQLTSYIAFDFLWFFFILGTFVCNWTLFCRCRLTWDITSCITCFCFRCVGLGLLTVQINSRVFPKSQLGCLNLLLNA